MNKNRQQLDCPGGQLAVSCGRSAWFDKHKRCSTAICWLSAVAVQSLSLTPRLRELCLPGSAVFDYLAELLTFKSIASVMPSNHLIPCRPFSSCLQSFPASGSFPVSQFFISGGQRIGASASASVLPRIFRVFFRMDWLDLLEVQGTLKSLLQFEIIF